MTRGWGACVLALLCAAAPAWAATPAEFVAALDRAAPIHQADLSRLLPVVPHCAGGGVPGRTDCEAREFRVAGLVVDRLDYREGAFGSLFILELGNADCVPVGEFDRVFGEGANTLGCTDGVTCIYRGYRRRWGRLSLGLGSDWSRTDCVHSVILDTSPT